jgi:hypothetical protein
VIYRRAGVVIYLVCFTRCIHYYKLFL